MPAELPRARVIHRVPGRLRLRIEGKRGERDWFDEVATTLAMAPGVDEVAASARTGSLKLRHTVPAEELFDTAVTRGLFAVEGAGGDAAEGSPAARLRAAAGGFGLKETVAAMLIMAALRQIARGQVLPPAITLLAYAATLLAARADQSDNSDERSVDSHAGTGEPPPT